MRDIVTYIIAEAGVNHNGDFGKAIQLCQVAKDAGTAGGRRGEQGARRDGGRLRPLPERGLPLWHVIVLF